jgi:midasin (ATPase involved in ribosome maturation)
MRNGDWFVADEINASSADILFVYHSLLDDDGYVVLPENGGEIVKPHPNFRFFATLNPSSDYHGVKELNKALMSRFLVLKTDFASPTVEAKILVERTGIDKDSAERMVRFAGDIRATHSKDKIQFVLSTRDLLMWAKMYTIYGKYMVSAEMTVLNKVGQDDFEMVKDMLSLQFKSLDEPAKKSVNQPTATSAGNPAESF